MASADEESPPNAQSSDPAPNARSSLRSVDDHGGLPSPARLGTRLTLGYFLRTFLLLNLGLGLLIAINSARTVRPIEELPMAGALLVATNETFTAFHPCGATIAVVLIAGMASFLVWPGWPTAWIAFFAASAWLWIGYVLASSAAC